MSGARTRLAWVMASVALMAFGSSNQASAARIKDIGHFDGVRANHLIGYGLVVGLAGTGDSQRSAFTPQTMEALMSRMGIRIDRSQLTLRNVAAVIVTAELPPFSQPGSTIDVTVSSIGDARSLSGGTLLLTALSPGGGEPYAFAQGALKVGSVAGGPGGFRSASADQLNVGRIAGGGRVERAVPIQLGEDGELKFRINRPDFGTASNLAEALNSAAPTFGGGAEMARVLDAGTVAIEMPDSYTAGVASFIAGVERLQVIPDQVARVVVNGRTGAVVLGANVRLSQVAIAYEGLTLEIFDPQPMGDGGGTMAPREALKTVPEAATLAEVVSGLNALGLSPRELIDLLEALSAAGALQGQLEVL